MEINWLRGLFTVYKYLFEKPGFENPLIRGHLGSSGLNKNYEGHFIPDSQADKVKTRIVVTTSWTIFDGNNGSIDRWRLVLGRIQNLNFK